MAPLANTEYSCFYRSDSKRKIDSFDDEATTVKQEQSGVKSSCLKTPSLSSRKPKKSVRFCPYSQQYDTLSVKDYTPEERDDSFLTAADKARIRIELNKTLRLMRTGQLPNTENEYFRGLEFELNRPKWERTERTELAFFAIQEYQAEHNNKLRDEWVDQFYCKITARGVQVGQSSANFDQLQADKVYEKSCPFQLTR